MPEALLLVDYENVKELPLAKLPAGWRVKIFVGRSQNTLPFELATEAQQLGHRLEWIKVQGDSRNNLDFHLALYLGKYIEQHRNWSFAILSRDKGFDCLIAHLAAQGVTCERLETIEKLKARPPSKDVAYEQAREFVHKIDKKKRPQRRKSLAAMLASHFQKSWSGEEVERVVGKFFTEGVVSESEGKLVYSQK